MRGTAPAVQAMIANSIFAGMIANDGPIAAVEQGMDIAMIAGSSKLTHMLIGAKNYKTWEDLRGATIGASTLTSGTAFVLRRALKIKGLDHEVATDLVQLYAEDNGHRARDGVLFRDGEAVAQVLDLPWLEEDEGHLQRAAERGHDDQRQQQRDPHARGKDHPRLTREGDEQLVHPRRGHVHRRQACDLLSCADADRPSPRAAP